MNNSIDTYLGGLISYPFQHQDKQNILEYINGLEKEIDELNRENKKLQKKAELGEHYKHLYSEVKKQKDDVVEYIKQRTIFGEYTIAYPGILNQDEVRKILRMLGEIDEIPKCI